MWSLIQRMTPSGRVGVAEDIAAAVAMVVEPTMDFLNEVAFPVAGGLNHPLSLQRVLG